MSEPETPERTPSAVLYAPAPTIREEPKPAAPRRTKQPAWYTKPPVIGCTVLGMLIVELVAYGLLRPLWWAVANGVALVLLFGAVLAWRRRGKGGLLDRLLTRWGRLGATRSRSAGARAGGKGNGRWSGLKGRSGGGGGGTKGSGRFAGLRSRLPRALGGTRGRAPNSNQGRTTGGGKPPSLGARVRSKLPRVLGGSRGRAGRSSQAGGTPAKGSGRKFGLSKLRKSRTDGTGPTGGKSSRTSNRKSKPWLMPFWSRKKKTTTKPTSDNKPTPKPADKASSKSSHNAPKADSQRPAGPKQDQITQPPALPAPRKQPGRPRHAAGSTQGGSVNDMQYSDDQSLQRWGANLGSASQAADEVARLFAEAEAAKARFNEVFGKMATQAESELPTSPTLVADVQSVKVRADQAASSDEWRAVAADAETLPATYRREHETDQDRLDSPRGGIAQEKRADVTAATQDN